ncbi:hypothetical protein D3C76_1267820 [compost metagenome]
MDAIPRHRQILIRNHICATDMHLAARFDIHAAAGRTYGADALALGSTIFVQLMTRRFTADGHADAATAEHAAGFFLVQPVKGLLLGGGKNIDGIIGL